LPQLVNLLSFQSVKDYEDYVSRLKQIPVLLEQTMVQMRKGITDKLMKPRFLLEKVVDQCHALASQEAGKSPFAQPFFSFPRSISESDQSACVMPALPRFGIPSARLRPLHHVRP